MKRVRVTMGGKVLAELDVDREMTIGRKAPADIVIGETEVSGRHAKLRPDGGQLFVSDLGSTNGSTLDGGPRLPPNEEILFDRGQKLAIGHAVIEIVETGLPESSAGFSATDRTVAISGGMMQSALVNIAR